MASCSLTNKAVLNIKECVTELKRSFLLKKVPINDDSSALHQLEEKLEIILQLGLKEKPGVFGVKKSYWDYIVACFSLSKRLHEGIKFLKSSSELRSSLGRGRALIRFCLMQKCLGDTLQNCFIDHKTTRDFYLEPYLPLHHKLWSSLVTILYDLNEINFDLNPQLAELDVSWPSFARKLFQSSGLSYTPPQVKYDTSSTMELLPEFEESKSMKDAQHLVEVNSELEANVLYLQKKCETLEKEICGANQKEAENEIVILMTPSAKCQVCANDDERRMINNNYYNPSSIKDSENGTKHIGVELDFKADLNVQDTPKLKSQFSCEKCQKDLQDVLNSKNVFPRLSTDYTLLHKNDIDFELQKTEDMECSLSLPNFEKSNASQSEPALKVKQTEFSDLNCVTSSDKFSPNGTDSSISSENSPFCLESYDSLNTLVLELKVLVDNFRNHINVDTGDPIVLSHFSHLKVTSDSLLALLQAQFKSFKKYDVPKSNIDEHLDIKLLALKQQNLIDMLVEKINSSVTENENLYDKLCFLKDKLQSYGLLKVKMASKSEPVNNSLQMEMSLASFDSNPDYCMNFDFEPSDYVTSEYLETVCTFKTSSSKLCSLNMQAAALQLQLDSSHKLSSDLILRVQDQELHMKGITRELEEAHDMLSVMRKQHKKLKSVESSVKYDLQEKRKLLTKLKQQLEETREDCNLVRLKNSKSEIEWKNLREEFAQRNKQASEESGFVDDKGIENSSCISAGCADEYILPQNAPCDEVCDNKAVEINQELKKSRLDNLEEQCQILCANLKRGSKKRQEIDCRLESWCQAIENSHKETSNLEEFKEIENGCNDCSKERTFEKINADSNSDAESSVSSLGIGSLSSDFSSDVPHNSTTISLNGDFSLESLKADQSVILLCDNSNFTQSDTLLEDADCFKVVSSSVKQICNDNSVNSIEIVENISSFDFSKASEELKKLEKKTMPPSEAKINESNEAEGSEQIELYEKCDIDAEKSCCKRDDISKYVYELEDEKRLLQSKCLELEKENIDTLKSLQLETEQLKLMEATKEQEISALRFQMNSEVLKYERHLKEFSVNNEGLKDMKQKVNDQEKFISTLEEALSEIQADQEGDKEHQWEQLQDIQLFLASQEEECISLSAEIEKLEDFKKYSIRNREALESEVLLLRNDLKELHKRVIKLLKEKDILWKSNDHLIYLQKIHIDDRWMKDREVSKCLGCRNRFSFLSRKHHCRQCGRIFCKSCSNNWLLTPSSSKQIRVCNECYMQHLEMKIHVRRDSNVLCIDDSEDEDDDVSQNLNRNTSFSSEIHRSTTNSIRSLPVFQISNLKEKNHFTSAPELFFPRESPEVSNIRSINNLGEIGPTGISGTLSIKAADEEELSFVNTGSSALHWVLKPASEAIPISLIYEDASCGDVQQPVLHQSACETEGVIHLCFPGLHKFHLDNTSSSTSRMLYYTLKQKNEAEPEYESR